MDNNSIRIRRPKDIERLSQRVINSILKSGEEVANAGKICNLGQLWLKAFEISKLEDIEKRLVALEKEKESRDKP
jgi:hypothetical protein